MKITGIHHNSVNVTDMERAARFYSEVLQFREIRIPSTFVTAGTNVRWFELGREQLHLMPAEAADPASGRHCAYHVEDANAAREHCRRQGVEIQETIGIPGADRFFIRDPDANLVEIIEWQQEYEVVYVDGQ